MTEKQRTALIGINQPDLARAYSRLVTLDPGLPTVVTGLDAMLQEARTREYDIYLMSVTLGQSNTPSCEPARKVYELVKDRVEKGLAHFMAVSGNDIAVELAQEAGIPSELNIDFRLLDWLESHHD